MHRISLTDVLLAPIECPHCDRCGIRMMLAQITPRQDGSEQRMFECRTCGSIETKIAADRLESYSFKR
jgi:hypothetical protein